jgi:soluble lytic murein transglycosylase-like protein
MTQHELIQLVVNEFTKRKLDPAVGCAIIQQESGWNANARSPVAAEDEKYGGAYGLCQILPPTAKALGYEGPPEGLFEPALNIQLLAELTASNAHRFGHDPLDLFSAHNSGKPFNRAPWSTAGMYVPSCQKHYAAWKLYLSAHPFPPASSV